LAHNIKKKLDANVLMSHAINYYNRPMFHRAIAKNKSGMFLWTKVHCR